MKYLKLYEDFNSKMPEVEQKDVQNFLLIFNSLYENHLTINEKKKIEERYGMINESWFSDLVDKGKKGVLKVASAAGEVLVDLAKKAKDILDFAKQLATMIGNYVKGQFNSLNDKIKNYAMKDAGFATVFIEFLEKKKTNKLKTYISGIGSFGNYVISGQMIGDIITRLSEVFSKVLNLGTNEGIRYLEDEFLLEAEETGEKKSFLQRLGEKVMSFPPFSWIPKIEELMKKGIAALGKIVDRFICWLTTGDADNILGSKFVKSINFLFQILELYIHFKVIGKLEEFKEMLMKSSGIEEITSQLQDKSMDEIWKSVGINSEEVVNNVKDAIKKIPYVGDILSVLDVIVMSMGVYFAVEPTLKRLS